MSEQRRWTLKNYANFPALPCTDEGEVLDGKERIEVCPVSELDAALAERDALKIERDALLTQVGMKHDVWDAAKALAESHCRAVGRLDASRLTDEVAALRAELAEVRAKAEALHTELRLNRPWTGEIRGVPQTRCGVCDWQWDHDASERHAPDCPAAPDYLTQAEKEEA